MATLAAEIDAVWDALHLDNNRPLGAQSEAIAAFYSHPVWTLNGLFSEVDPLSMAQRVAIAKRIGSLAPTRVADYGGGSGVLARLVAEASHAVAVDIVEPYPSAFFQERLRACERIRFVPVLGNEYDVTIAQDVLEHVDNPVEVAVRLVTATRMGGHVIFASCFHPVIKCHLPATFFLRWTFPILMRFAGLKRREYISGAEHASLFQRTAPIQLTRLERLEGWARLVGPLLNRIVTTIGERKRRLLTSTQAAGPT